MNLPGHFEISRVNGIMPSFDVDGSVKAPPAQLADDVGPVAVSKTGMPVVTKILRAADPLVADHVTVNRGAFAVHVKNFRRPGIELRKRIYQLAELMAGFPFQTQIFVRKRIEHQFPSGRVVRDIPVALMPVATHGTIFKSDPHAFVSSPLRQIAKDFFKSWDAFGNGFPTEPPGEAGNYRAPEQMRMVDALFPTIEGSLVQLVRLQRISKHGERGDRGVALTHGVLNLAGERLEIHPVQRLPEVDLEGFESVRKNRGDVAGGVLAFAGHGSDADG